MHVLIKARGRYGLSGYAVAKAAAIDRSYYRKIELGDYVPSVDVALKIASALEKLIGKQVLTASEIIFKSHSIKTKAARKKAA